MNDVKESFERDTRHHVLDVRHDSGDYKHLRWGRPKSSSYHVIVVTYPGGLTVFGDLGTFAFKRGLDLFRVKAGNDYRAEKCTAGAVWGWDQDAFQRRLDEYIPQWLKHCETADHPDLLHRIAECKNAVSESDGMYLLTSMAHTFALDTTDFWEGGFKRLSFSFEFICLAVATMAAEYDKRKATPCPTSA